MMKYVVAIVVTAAVLSSGCITRGNMSALDLDLRAPEQILAGRVEAQAVYEVNIEATNGPSIARAPDPRSVAFAWADLFKLFEVTQGRVRVLTAMWDCDPIPSVDTE